MGRRKSAPPEVTQQHAVLLVDGTAQLAEKRRAYRSAEILLYQRIQAAFAAGMTALQIQPNTATPDKPEGYSLPRLYQINEEHLEASSWQ